MKNIFQQRYFKINRTLLLLVGQWPFLSRSTRLTAVFVFVCIVTSQVVPKVLAILDVKEDPDAVIECMPPFGIDVGCAIKLITLVVNCDKMMKLLQYMEIDWKILEHEPEYNILESYAETGKRFTIIYAVGLYLAGVCFLYPPAVPKVLQIIHPTNNSEPAKYPFPVNYYGLDLETYYFYFLMHSTLVAVAILTVFIAADTLFIIQIQHGCAMFAVVGQNFKKMAETIDNNYDVNIESRRDPTFRHLAFCIRKHNDVIKYSELLESCYTWAFFTIVGFNMIAISLTGYQTLVLMDDNPEAATSYALFGLAQIVHLFFQSFFAQRLMDHSEQVYVDMCQSEWYKTSILSQKLLSLITMRTYVPCQLTAGKFMVMSLQTFTTVIKTSMSYFTLLRSMQ